MTGLIHQEGTPVKTIDCTPTWQALLPIMLMHVEEKGAHTEMRHEFIKLAIAADSWNEHAKAMDAMTDEERDAFSPMYLNALERATEDKS